jgi:hypothetical protein
MRRNILKFPVIVLVLLSMASAWSCSVRQRKACKSPNETKRALVAGIAKAADSDCHVKPCRSGENRLFLLPDTSSRRHQKDRPFKFSMAVDFAGATSMAALSFDKGGKAVLKLPLSYHPPSFFVFRRAFLC